MGIVVPCHLLPWWGLMEISMNFHGFGGYLCCWRSFVHDIPLKLPYLDIWRSRPISWLKKRARAKQLTCLKVKAIYHIWKSMCFWRSRLIIWPPLLNYFYSFILIWNLEESHQICAGWFGKYIFTKLIPKVNGKMFGIQLKNTVFYGHR